MPPGARAEGGRRSVEGRERAISQEGLIGYWALKGCEGLAGRLSVGRGRGVRHTPKPVMRTFISCSEWCTASEVDVSAEPEELALLSPMAVVVVRLRMCGVRWVGDE